MSKRNLCKFGLVLTAVLLLNACGFRLQGTGSLPEGVADVYVQTNDRFTYFYRSLRDELELRGATLAAGPESADMVLRVIEDSRGQRVSAVSIRNTPLEFEVFYTVEYAVQVGEQQVLEPTRIVTKNRYEYDETLVLGKEEERDMLASAQAKDIARQVMMQLSAL